MSEPDKDKERFECDYCERTFLSKQGKKSHMAASHENAPRPKCEICSKEFAFIGGKRVHMRRFHENAGGFDCDVCGKTFGYKQSKNNHMLVVHQNAGRHKCDWPGCEKTFQAPGGLKTHRRIHTGEMPFECKLCPKKFNDRGNFKRHLLDCHSERKFKCDDCGQTFGNRSSLNAHRKIHTAFFQCDICGDVFRRADALRGHQKIHSGDKRFACDWPGCNKRFEQKTSLTAHAQQHYLDPDELTCKICQKTFTQKNSIKLHHFLMHTDGYSHECTVCQEKFKSSQQLKGHLLAVHRIEQETSFQCKIAGCKKYFEKYAGLRKHFPVHSLHWPHNCLPCLKYFKTKTELEKHKQEQGHTGDVSAIKIKRDRKSRVKRRPSTAAQSRTESNVSASGDSASSDDSDESDELDSSSDDPVGDESKYNLRKRGQSTSYVFNQEAADQEDGSDTDDKTDENDDGDEETCSDGQADVKMEPDDEAGMIDHSQNGMNVTRVKIERKEIHEVDFSDSITANRKKIKLENNANDDVMEQADDPVSCTSSSKLKLVYDTEYVSPDSN